MDQVIREMKHPNQQPNPSSGLEIEGEVGRATQTQISKPSRVRSGSARTGSAKWLTSGESAVSAAGGTAIGESLMGFRARRGGGVSAILGPRLHLGAQFCAGSPCGGDSGSGGRGRRWGSGASSRLCSPMLKSGKAPRPACGQSRERLASPGTQRHRLHPQGAPPPPAGRPSI